MSERFVRVYMRLNWVIGTLLIHKKTIKFQTIISESSRIPRPYTQTPPLLECVKRGLETKKRNILRKLKWHVSLTDPSGNLYGERSCDGDPQWGHLNPTPTSKRADLLHWDYVHWTPVVVVENTLDVQWMCLEPKSCFSGNFSPIFLRGDPNEN